MPKTGLMVMRVALKELATRFGYEIPVEMLRKVMFAPAVKLLPEMTNGWALVEPTGEAGITLVIAGDTAGART